ncbi:MAG: CbtA family protein [Nocardioidaceae bacterium]
MRFASLLRYGLAAGAAAGLGAALNLWLLVEPVIRRALVIEDARGMPEHDEVVTRGQQVVAGLLTEVVVGALFGVVFAIVFARVQHRLPGSSDQGRAICLALLGFGVFVLLPAIRIPANPPSVGDPATVGRRTLIYLATILSGLLIAGAGFGFDAWLRGTTVSPAVRRCLVVLGAVAGFAVLMLVVPRSPDRIPRDVPAGLIWQFRTVSLAQLAVLWGVLGLGFGLLVERKATRRSLVAA